MEAPERIYINDVQSRKWFAMASTTDIEYVRADLFAAKDAELVELKSLGAPSGYKCRNCGPIAAEDVQCPYCHRAALKEVE